MVVNATFDACKLKLTKFIADMIHSFGSVYSRMAVQHLKRDFSNLRQL